MRLKLALLALGFVVATPAAAQLRAVPEQVADEREALNGVEVFLVNEGTEPVDAEGPREIELTATDGTRLVLQRMPAPKRSVAPGGFVKARYVPVGLAGVAIPPNQAHPPASMPGPGETVASSSTGSSSAFLDRFEPHEPIYGVAGLNDSGAKLQVSFAFRPFAADAPLKLGNLRFAYTQTMFWALDEPSGPFRSTVYSPEVYADIPMGEHTVFSLGYRHDSNGRGLPGSIDVNRLFVRAQGTIDLGNEWRLDIAPMGWLYVGREGGPNNLRGTWGHSAITAAIQQENGLKVSATARGSFETGRYSGEMSVSYPIGRLTGGGLGIYLFGQGFTGWGETLDDIDVRDTHFRIGISLTR
ncbi:phospholipase A [Sphingomonas sp. AOB5]|uniref:phospholipase A n=1 Tax=Sphingomonas sp. AOB5 TaxID=3034017 RepID=UPI0023F68E4B|nr:phospholipase A [Sphingomonas sp. AOB5]MDF7776054.1 phospholipase A [Sphingomonas sp. AOB5]